jgi:hypothetical protein
VEVVLEDSAGAPKGLLAMAPSGGEMVVVASGLGPSPEGSSYGCWAEIDGRRAVLGTMQLVGDVGWWAGPVAMSGPIAAGTRFGVSVVGPGGSMEEAVLTGSY